MRKPYAIASKVRVTGFEQFGFGEVASLPDHSGSVSVDFYRGPVQFERVRTDARNILRSQIPDQTRCFLPSDEGFRIGRLVGCVEGPDGAPVVYHVALPNEQRACQLDETQFHVRSHLGPADPIETLTALAHETPFFFERRAAWVTTYDRHAHASRGLQGLDAAGVELFPHQADAVRRVLQDPHVRYLLADEVGLGKTIEAGAILRQLESDSPNLQSLVLVPAVLRSQWELELRGRFQLERTVVAGHDELDRLANCSYDLLVVDEAHRLINWANHGAGARFQELRAICASARYLLLLSATPILHRDAEVLALLHLLDPEQYSLEDIDGFRRRVARRVPIGRLLLALERASSPVILRRQLQLLGEELSDDDDLQALISEAPSAVSSEERENWRALATRARILVAETWRLHRRLVRTQRSALLEEGEIQRLRQLSPPETAHTYSERTEAITSMWAWLDELRTATAARAARMQSNAQKLMERYLELAQAAALMGPRFGQLLHEMRDDPDWVFASDTLEQVLRADADVSPLARLMALKAALMEGVEAQARWVVFCSDGTEVEGVAGFLVQSFPEARVLMLSESNAGDAGPLLTDFSTSSGSTLLVVDRTAEEGLNLQAADGLILYDLPFDPLRLEQRIGRLDRLDRTRPLRAITILSIDDSADACLSFDRAWYEVLVSGLGLFDESIADVPYLLERQMEEMAHLAFERGPAALYEHIESLKALLAVERRETEELAVIDGTSVAGVTNSSWWNELDDADADEEQLASAFAGYIEQTLGLRLEAAAPDDRRGGMGAFMLRRNKRRDVLLPADRLLPLANLVQVPYTFSRRRATRDASLELLRPGARLLDWLRELADWDDRGRAFVMWRRVPEWHDPRVLARVNVLATLGEERAGDEISEVGWASVRRMTANWFAPFRSEWFLHVDGAVAHADEAALCLLPYDRREDINLGGTRVPSLLSVVPADRWARLCQRWATAALEQVQKSPEFDQRLSQARSDAIAWFAQRETRLRLRERRDIADDIADELGMLSKLREHVDHLLAQPRLTVDAIGVYVLSAEVPEA